MSASAYYGAGGRFWLKAAIPKWELAEEGHELDIDCAAVLAALGSGACPRSGTTCVARG